VTNSGVKRILKEHKSIPASSVPTSDVIHY